jgi:acyl-homoserine lactone acylase PvdQ
MASSYTVLGTEKMTTGENAGNWGTKTNTNLEILEQAFGGYLSKSIAGGVQTTTLAITDGDSTASTSEARHHVIKLTGAITGNQTVTVTAKEKWWIIDNQTSGASFRIFVDTRDWDNTLGMNVPGQVGDPDHPLYANLFDLWATDKVFPVFYSRQKIETVLFEKLDLIPAN